MHANYFFVSYANLSQADTIRRNLFSSLQDFDVYMPIFTRGGPGEPVVNDTSVCEGLRPSKAGSNLFCEVKSEKRILSDFDPPGIWETFCSKDRRMHEGLLQQLYGLHRCSTMIRSTMLHSGVDYDYIIRLRPDMAVYEPMPPINQVVVSSHVIKYVDESVCCCGNVDWFGIGSSTAMLPYLERYVGLQTLGHTVLSPTEDVNLPPERPWTAEIFLERYMRIYFNVTLEADSRLSGCLIKPTSRAHPSSP
jgi:hypothetical protein